MAHVAHGLLYGSGITMTHSTITSDALSLVTTVPASNGDPNLMGTLVDSHIRWKLVHEQAQLIAARNAARKRVDAECQQAERRARRALNLLTTTIQSRKSCWVPWLFSIAFIGAVMAAAWMLASASV